MRRLLDDNNLGSDYVAIFFYLLASGQEGHALIRTVQFFLVKGLGKDVLFIFGIKEKQSHYVMLSQLLPQSIEQPNPERCSAQAVCDNFQIHPRTLNELVASQKKYSWDYGRGDRG